MGPSGAARRSAGGSAPLGGSGSAEAHGGVQGGSGMAGCRSRAPALREAAEARREFKGSAGGPALRGHGAPSAAVGPGRG
uniref:histone-lysine N-methyltransferase, H3 lysine-9 specific SUVH3-like n=1 Tax=Macaca mulatta TaxID=9544 RepID=UPI0010A25BF6|nr:histone-lysine N-methyltransferase, H3 lysine-9 specific SUVH3-like [Macaca mulatta]